MAATSIYDRSFLLLSLLFIVTSSAAGEAENNKHSVPKPIGSHRYSSYVNVTVGEDSDNPIYALAQCRRDVNASECFTCITNAAQDIVETCRYQPDARVWYDHCFLRYDTEDFVQQLDVGLYVHHETPQLVPSTMTNFSDVLYQCFINDIGNLLVKHDSRGFAKASRQIDDSYTVNGIAQCTQDIDPDECFLAMTAGVQSFNKYCRNRNGCVVATSSCYVKYEVHPSYSPYKTNAKGARKLLSSHGSP